MLQTYTEAQMLRYWKRRLGLIAPDTPEAAEALTDLTEMDRRLLDDIEAWYAELLRTAPAGDVPVEDLASEAVVLMRGEGVATVRLPDRGARVVEVMLEGWNNPLRIFAAPHSDLARLQRYVWTRGTPDDPAAILLPGRLEIYGVPPGEPQLRELLMVARPEAGFALNPALLRNAQLLVG